MASHFFMIAVLWAFPVGMALAGSIDLITMTIPNRLCLAIAVGFFVLAALARAPADLVLFNLSCGAAALVTTFALFSLGWIGGGDAKLAAATALWLGWGALLEYCLTAAIYGGVLTVVLILARKMPLPGWLAGREWVSRLHDPKTGVPYGVALAAAGIMSFPQTEIWRALTAGPGLI